MKGRFLINSYEARGERNIYADKASLVLEWLLLQGPSYETFSIREVSEQTSVSLGLVQGIFQILVNHGILKTEGIRTSKTFTLNKPHLLLQNWLNHYSILKKCKMWTYRSRLNGPNEMLNILKKSGLHKDIVLALHSAAEALGYKNTNLETLELYVAAPDIRSQLEDILQLEPQERGYEVLLIDPYYKSLLKKHPPKKPIRCSSPLLTFLDLYHFPLRGQEQAEFLAERLSELKDIYKKT